MTGFGAILPPNPLQAESLCQIKQNVHYCEIGPVRCPNIPVPCRYKPTAEYVLNDQYSSDWTKIHYEVYHEKLYILTLKCLTGINSTFDQN